MGENNPNWKGGRIAWSTGYIKIYKPQHPNACVDGYVLEHDLIAEKVLGRPLKRGEVVHHINGDNTDSRNCNLLICTQSYHAWLHSFDRERDKLGRFV